jgi:hypothetical protein
VLGLPQRDQCRVRAFEVRALPPTGCVPAADEFRKDGHQNVAFYFYALCLARVGGGCRENGSITHGRLGLVGQMRRQVRCRFEEPSEVREAFVWDVEQVGEESHLGGPHCLPRHACPHLIQRRWAGWYNGPMRGLPELHLGQRLTTRERSRSVTGI